MHFRYYFVAVAMIFCSAISCLSGNTKGDRSMINDTSMPYIERKNFPGLYDNLIERKNDDIIIEKAISQAKNAAKTAGYPLTGDKLEKYLFDKQEYPIDISSYENARYYIILLVPRAPRTSLDLEIIIEKKSNKVVSILQGS